MTGFAALVTACLGVMLLGFVQLGQLVAFHQNLQHQAESFAVKAAAQLHKGEDPCAGMPDIVLDCRADKNVAHVEIADEIEVLGRRFSLKNRASVANQWVEFTDESLL